MADEKLLTAYIKVAQNMYMETILGIALTEELLEYIASTGTATTLNTLLAYVRDAHV